MAGVSSLKGWTTRAGVAVLACLVTLAGASVGLAAPTPAQREELTALSDWVARQPQTEAMAPAV